MNEDFGNVGWGEERRGVGGGMNMKDNGNKRYGKGR